jgi:2-oxoglutarate ferredoxin oxidoreductase subunit alpha
VQARWGSHGDYEMIALCPNSPQECFDLTIRAFNLSERFRTPVMFMMDECVGHMTEKVVIPPAEEIEIYPRRRTTRRPGEYLTFEPEEDLVPAMAHAGEGHRFHMTGLTHDDRSYPVLNPRCRTTSSSRLMNKIRLAEDEIAGYEKKTRKMPTWWWSPRDHFPRGPGAIGLAQAKGLRVGKLRLITVWPFSLEIRQLASPLRHSWFRS